MPDFKLLKFHWVLLSLHLVFDSATLLHKVSQDVGQDSILNINILIREFDGVLLIFLLFFLLLIILASPLFNSVVICDLSPIEVFRGSPVHSGEAQIVLLDDRGVETVEIEEQNDAVVEAGLGLDDQTTRILGLLSLRTLLASGGSGLRLVIVSEETALQVPGRQGLLVWEDKLLLLELMEQEHLVTLGSRILQRTEP